LPPLRDDRVLDAQGGEDIWLRVKRRGTGLAGKRGRKNNKQPGRRKGQGKPCLLGAVKRGGIVLQEKGQPWGLSAKEGKAQLNRKGGKGSDNTGEETVGRKGKSSGHEKGGLSSKRQFLWGEKRDGGGGGESLFLGRKKTSIRLTRRRVGENHFFRIKKKKSYSSCL